MSRFAPLLAVFALLAGCTTPAPTNAPTPLAELPTVAVNIATVTPPLATNTATAEPPTATTEPTATSVAPPPATATASQNQASVLTVLQNANLRGGPGTAYDVVGSLNAGSTAEVLGRDASGSWLAVRVGDQQSWIARDLVSYAGEVSALPILAAPPTPRVVAALTPTVRAVSSATGGARGITGSLQMCGGKTTFAAGTERICFIETIRNTTNATVQYGIIGVLATNTATGATQFQSSWSAFTGPLAIDPGCTGPTDRCGGPWEDGMYIATPGTYRLTLNICFTPSIEGCTSGGDWVTLTPGIEIVVR
ncbi:MAG: SH3 domain-containing protein [Anaerolineales bacterium]|nr:SH3 domain-containing protein [Anaerolineales bacterium]